MTETKKMPGAGGNIYVPYDERSGGESIVYFTKDLSADGLCQNLQSYQRKLDR